MYLDKNIKALCKTTANDGRPVIEAVKLEKKRAIATDGFMLMTIDLPEAPEDLADHGHTPLKGDSWLLSAKKLNKALAAIPQNPKIPSLAYAWTALPTGNKDDKTVAVVSTDGETTTTQNISNTEGEYPNVDKIMERKGKKYHKTSIDAKLLMQLCKAIIDAGANERRIIVEVAEEPHAPILFSAKTSDRTTKPREIKAVLMPLRVDL